MLRSGLLYFFRATILTLLTPVLKQWRERYQKIPTVTPDAIPEMEPQPLEGYTDKPFYLPGEAVSFKIHSEFDQNKLTLYRLSAPYTYIPVFELKFPKTIQKQVKPVPDNGLDWTETLSYTIPKNIEAGYYRAHLSCDKYEGQTDITFIIGNAGSENKIAVLAPVTTWLAYNPYGGKSLYKNAIDGTSVYIVNSLRPNTALQYNPVRNIHDVNVEANSFNWLNKEFGADVFPDYMLEQSPELLQKYDILVLAYHTEYFSEEMYKRLRELVYTQKKSLLSLGGNAVFWQVKWSNNFTKLECRKDASEFEGNSKYGGMWRQTNEPEDKLLGVRFTDAGMGTYAPYKVLKPDHWLFEGAGVQKNDLFGLSGINQIPICGDETDKRSVISASAVTLLAKGLNKKDVAEFEVYDRNDSSWNCSGGGDFVMKELSEKHAVLSTGSIQSGAGLGSDVVFSLLIRNFVKKYLQ